uniref:CHCH domain-containing protein n=1 Tax=Buteo japonicus TaxID=224669 RepID=A0A8C0BSP3_9AVES
RPTPPLAGRGNVPVPVFWLCLSLLEATCITEMSVMMACWKQNDFSDTACAEEIRMFYDCVAKAEVIKASFATVGRDWMFGMF